MQKNILELLCSYKKGLIDKSTVATTIRKELDDTERKEALQLLDNICVDEPTQMDHGLLYPINCVSPLIADSLFKMCCQNAIHGIPQEDMIAMLVRDFELSDELAVYFVTESYKEVLALKQGQ